MLNEKRGTVRIRMWINTQSGPCCRLGFVRGKLSRFQPGYRTLLNVYTRRSMSLPLLPTIKLAIPPLCSVRRSIRQTTDGYKLGKDLIVYVANARIKRVICARKNLSMRTIYTYLLHCNIVFLRYDSCRRRVRSRE